MPFKPLALLVLVALLIAAAVILTAGNSPAQGQRQVVVYTSVDAESALPLFERFTKETGIAVLPRTDGESAKTTGMAERLLQMKDRPDGDVFWNSEQSFTLLLAEKGCLEAYASPQAAGIPAEFRDVSNRWSGFACRARVLIYNTDKVKPEELPRTLEDLCAPRWKDRFVLAKPLFGTTRSHLVALALVLGEEKAFNLFRRWRENGAVVAESNSDVRNRVAEGMFDIGLTDTDDVFAAMDRKKPVNYVVPDQTAECRGAFLIPNTVAMLKNGPHPAEARIFIDYLLRPETELWLAEQDARQIPVRPKVGEKGQIKIAEWVKVDSSRLAAQVLPLGERIYRVLTGEEK
jgi:iron(III) transport system substrate-binding protein